MALAAHGLVDHPQGSVYQGRDLHAYQCWLALYFLRRLAPDGIFSSCVKEIEMFHLQDANVMICSDLIRVGGMHSPDLLGPTPFRLIPPNV